MWMNGFLKNANIERSGPQVCTAVRRTLPLLLLCLKEAFPAKVCVSVTFSSLGQHTRHPQLSQEERFIMAQGDSVPVGSLWGRNTTVEGKLLRLWPPGSREWRKVPARQTHPSGELPLPTRPSYQYINCECIHRSTDVYSAPMIQPLSKSPAW